MKTIGGAVVAACLAGALTTGGAAAAETGAIRPVGYPVQVALAGGQVVWTEPDGPSVEVWAGAPDRAPERLDRVAFQPGCDGYLRPSLAASPSLALLSTFAYFDRCDGQGTRAAFSQHHLGSVGGPLDRIARCEAADYLDHFDFAGLRPADVWEQAYAYWQCDDEGGHVEVRDTSAQPVSPSRSVGDGGFAPRIAGRFVAWLDNPVPGPDCTGPDIAVYDRVADAEVYRVSRCEFGLLQSFDLQEDGKVALAFERRGQEVVVGWASPAEPYVHQLDLPARDGYSVRIADDRIAFQYGYGPRGTIGLATLDGELRTVVRNTDALPFIDSFDYDGDRFLWQEFGCERRRLVVHEASTAGVAPGGATRCRLRLLRRPDVQRRVVVLWFGCGGFKPPCDFVTRLRFVGHGGGRAGETEYGDNSARIKFTPRARRLLRREGSLRVRVKARLDDAFGRRQTRFATIRLQRD